MSTRGPDAYVAEKILTSDGVELVRMLYAAARDFVRSARRALAAGEIQARSAAVSDAVDILAELNGSLRYSEAPELCQNLARLYDYMQRRLLAANFDQSDEPLAEVLRLLDTLSEAWNHPAFAPMPPSAPA